MISIERTIEKLKKEGLDLASITKCLDFLRHIYIGENIRGEGILLSRNTIDEHEREFQILLEKGFIEGGSFGNSYGLYKVTPRERTLGNRLVEKQIKRERENVKKELSRLPQRLISFLVHEYIDGKLVFEKGYATGRDWRKLVLKFGEVESLRQRLFSILEDVGLCVVTRDYDLYKGVHIHLEHFVISPETCDFLSEIYLQQGLTWDEQHDFRVYHFLLSKLQRLPEHKRISINFSELRLQGPFGLLYPKLESLLKELAELKIITRFEFTNYEQFGFIVPDKDIMNEHLERQVRQKISHTLEIVIHSKGDKVLDRYELITLLGVGAQKRTWKAVDHELDREVALKRLLNMREIEVLLGEAKVAGKLKHQNIARLFNIHKDQGYLVEEFVNGDNLEKIMKDHVLRGTWFDVVKSIDILKQLLEAVSYTHQNVKPPRIHGDIKPANIMIQKDGVVKLTDFGVGKILSKRRNTEYSVEDRKLGSINWLAPEVLKGGRRTRQSDLFSLGIVAYLLFTQNHPFLHPSGCISIEELIKSKTFHPIPLTDHNPSISETLNEIVFGLLEKKVRSRSRNATKVLEKLSNVCVRKVAS